MKIPDNYVVIDIETDSLNPYTAKIDRIGYWKYNSYSEVSNREPCFINRETYYLRHGPIHREVLIDKLKSDFYPLVFHNAKFDLHILRTYEFKVNGPIHDTMLLAKTWRNNLPSYSLEALSYYIFGDPCLTSGEMAIWFQQNPKKTIADAPDGLVRRYCKGDVMRTKRLFKWLYPRVMEQNAGLYELEIEAMLATLEVERNGIYIDREYYESYIRRSKQTLHRIEKTLGFNPRSPKQLGEALLKAGHSVKRTRTGLVATDERSLRDYVRNHPNPIITKVIRSRTLTKNVSTYAENLVSVSDSGQFHPNFQQSFAITRRFSSSGWYGDAGQIVKGNTQNIPLEMREGFIAPDRYRFAALDLSQIESRIWALMVYSLLGDDTWLKLYNEDPDFNMYMEIARLCRKRKIRKSSKLYDMYKAVVLARYYGSGVNTFAEQQDIPYSEAIQLYNETDIEVPQIKALQHCIINIIKRKGYIVDGFGSRYYVHENKAYTAVDHVCQGWAGAIMKKWLIDVQKELCRPDKIVNLVHDELDLYVCVCTSARNEEFWCQHYCSLVEPIGDTIGIKLKADYVIADNWKDAK